MHTLPMGRLIKLRGRLIKSGASDQMHIHAHTANVGRLIKSGVSKRGRA